MKERDWDRLITWLKLCDRAQVPGSRIVSGLFPFPSNILSCEVSYFSEVTPVFEHTMTSAFIWRDTHMNLHTNIQSRQLSQKLTQFVFARGLMGKCVLQNQFLAKKTFHLPWPTRIFPIVCLQDHSWRVILALHSLLQLHRAAVNDVHVFLGDLWVDVDVRGCLCKWQGWSMEANTYFECVRLCNNRVKTHRTAHANHTVHYTHMYIRT